MNNQPDTFASVKKRWRQIAIDLVSSVAEVMHNPERSDALDDCADELEDGLEKRFRELRDDELAKADAIDDLTGVTECAVGARLHRQFADKLTTLLGKETT